MAAHEEGHRQIATQVAKDMEKTMWGLSCTDNKLFKEMYTATVNKMLKALDAKEAAYDAKTDHGETQGAVF